VERRHAGRERAAPPRGERFVRPPVLPTDNPKVHRGFLRFVLRRAVLAALLVLLVSSVALVLALLAPGTDAALDTNPDVVAAERTRYGLDDPLIEQYGRWLGRGLRLDFGESIRFRRPVSDLLRERAANTAWLGLSALLLATAIGIPLGVLTGSRRGGILIAIARGASLCVLSIPPLVTSLVLLLIALRTGVLPAGGLSQAPDGAGAIAAAIEGLRSLILPSLALGLPIAASLERLQSRSIAEALAEPCIIAALARGVSRSRVVWRHGLRLSLKPVVAVYGITIGSVLSGSFAVEIVMSWPGLGSLMFEALKSRDVFLVAGCAATGSVFLAAGVLLADIALAVVDPRIEEPS
jgi:peptide/nickel transport system permease protein